MMIFLALTAIVFAIASRYGTQGITAALLVYTTSLAALALGAIEIAHSQVDIFKSDELFYINSASNLSIEELTAMERGLWHALNHWIINYDISYKLIPLKIINIPLLALFAVYLLRLFESDPFIRLLPIFLPYTAWLSGFNLRDIAIWLTTIVFIYHFFRGGGKNSIVAMCALAALYKLRPFASFVLVGSVITFITLRFIGDLRSNRSIGRGGASLLATAAGIGISAYLFWDSIFRIATRYAAWLVFTTGEGRAEHISRVAANYTSKNLIADTVIGMVRYATTPLPSSLMERILAGSDTIWGITDDIVRIFHQTSYYALSSIVIINTRYLPAVYRMLTDAQKAFFVAMLVYWPIYSFHLFGVTHQRSKLPLQIIVFILASMVLRLRHDAKQGYSTGSNVYATS